MIEALGIFLTLLGIVFAFAPPRRKFISMFKPNRGRGSPAKNQEGQLEVAAPVLKAAPSAPSPLEGLNALDTKPQVATASGPLVVTFQDGSKASVELFVTLNVPTFLAPSFIAKNGSFEQGMSTAKHLIEAAARAVLEQVATLSALRNSRQRIERDIEVHVRPKVSALSVHLETVAIGEANDA